MEEQVSGTMQAEGAAGGADGTKGELKAAGREAVSRAKETARDVRDQVKERAAETVADKKTVLADSLGSVVTALRAAEQALRDDRQEGLATYSGQMASYVERSTEYVRRNDMSGLMEDLQRVGRENTGMFMGSTFAAGAALGHFLRASAPQPERTEPASGGGTLQVVNNTTSGASNGTERTSPSRVIGEGEQEEKGMS